MKKYIPKATKWFAALALVSAAILAAGIVLILVGSVDIGLQIGFTMMGSMLGILFLSVCLASRSRTLVLDENCIVFPRGAQVNGKRPFRKTVVKTDEVRLVESCFRKGDGIVAADTYFHILTLADGTKLTVTLYEYGKESEKEILEWLHSATFRN